jgi:AraC-like DNA-binding protein
MKQQYLIRSGALTGYERHVKSLNGDSSSLLAACGLTKQDLSEPDTMIPFNVMVRLLELSAEQLNCPDFGLTLGMSQNIHALGSLGLLMQHCKNARELITSTQRFIAVHSQAEYWRLHEEGEFAFIERFSVSQDVSHARQIKELSFGVCIKLIKTLIKGSIIIEQLEFAHAPISNASAYKRLLGCKVLFNQEYDRLVIKRQYLNYEMENLTTDNKHALELGLTAVLSQYGDDMERQITTIILQTLSIQGMSLDNIALLLNTNKRTLQRKLKANNLSFKSILSEVRLKTACWHLEASSMDITLLSEILGYSDISAFSKAFRHKTGSSPLQWRKLKRQKSN